MKRLVSFLAVRSAFLGATVIAAFALVAPSLCAHAADPGGEQGEARRERKAGNILSIRQIEQLVLPRMGAMQYLGPEYDAAAMAYRLKFIQNGKVYFVDVDARTGRVIGQSR
ncbi:peptidase YpeB-like protein [Novosphingobium sp. PhB165]|uniref:PepSY domain-containing protein n=1 Tax=Novosphingobium sp. PhB165 TaxID=2485105 RepID=UPI001046A4E7|nr:PepSY domain-containing protein [Novosphingobium sp. PhB165]TCM22456.1 peptidase YpeB-like protein [Novosphingobium sp. PhB165]